MERLIFPVVNYSDFMRPIVLKPKHSAAIFTMNCPNDQMFQGNGYDILMDMSARQLGMFGPATILRAYDTYQFNDYSRYDAAQIDAAHKAAMHESQFPKDLENAYQLGKHLVEQQTLISKEASKLKSSLRDYNVPLSQGATSATAGDAP